MKPIIPRYVAGIVLALGILGTILSFYPPVQGPATHSVGIFCIALCLVSSVSVSPKFVGGLFVFALGLLLVTLWPAPTDPATLASEARDLRLADGALIANYHGTRYVRGGINGRGLDGLGLVRRGYIDSHLVDSVFDRDPSLARDGITMWMVDPVGTDPAAMFPDKLRLVSRVPSLSAVPANRIHLGDIAVTGGGSVYLENLAANTWATVGYTPSGPMETMDLIKIPENNPVYAIPAQIYRWRDMDH